MLWLSQLFSELVNECEGKGLPDEAHFPQSVMGKRVGSDGMKQKAGFAIQEAKEAHRV